MSRLRTLAVGAVGGVVGFFAGALLGSKAVLELSVPEFVAYKEYMVGGDGSEQQMETRHVHPETVDLGQLFEDMDFPEPDEFAEFEDLDGEPIEFGDNEEENGEEADS